MGAPWRPDDEISGDRLRRRPPAQWSLGIASLVFATFVFRLSQTEADPDLWGHLKFGDDLWRTGQVVRADVYSYLTGDRPWVNHEWLAEAVMALAYRWGGAPALIGLKVLLGLALVAVLALQLRRQQVSALATALLVSYTMVLVLPGLGSVRPQLWTYLFLALLLVLIDRAERSGPGWLWPAVPLFALWANAHGGVLAGVGIAAGWAAAHLTWFGRGRGAETRRVLPPVAAMALATLANPHGASLWAFLLRTAVGPRPDIVEWRPVALASVEGVAYSLALTLGVVALLGTRRRRTATQILLFAGTAALPLLARRHAALFAIAGVVVAGPHVADVCARTTARLWPRGQVEARDRRGVIAWLLFAEAALLCVLSVPHFRRIDVDASQYPVGAVQLLSTSGIAGHLAVFFDWGEYVLWHLGPRIKVSIDGRRETVYSEQIQQENLMFMDGTGDWAALLRKHDTHLALVHKNFPTWNLMTREPGWILLYEDDLSGLFGRQGWPALSAVHAAQSRTPARPLARFTFPGPDWSTL
jgi:hypothetical protein